MGGWRFDVFVWKGGLSVFVFAPACLRTYSAYSLCFHMQCHLRLVDPNPVPVPVDVNEYREEAGPELPEA